jgi:hypothetical protein
MVVLRGQCGPPAPPDEREPRDLGVDLVQLPRGDGGNLNRVRIGDEVGDLIRAEAEMLGVLDHPQQRDRPGRVLPVAR